MNGNLKYSSFGKTDLKPSKIGFGCSQIASLSTRHLLSDVRATLLSAFDRGINFFDTADVYGQGDSERLLGDLFRRKRDQVIFCSKAGMQIGVSQVAIRLIKPIANPLLRRWHGTRSRVMRARQRAERQCFEPQYLYHQIESSLRRLKTDYLDIFLLHSPPVSIGRETEVFDMIKEIMRKGLIRYFGISASSSEDALSLMTLDEIDCLQVPANIEDREALRQVLPRANERQLALIAREPFGGGKIFKSTSFKKLCNNYLNRTPPQIALQYLTQRTDSGVILIGMTCQQHLHQNLDAIDMPLLSEYEINLIERHISDTRN